ncbi:MAG: PAS domain S-box protein [Kiloniellales bacterium]|nr:PAS domain S-box protein [Kiloniellales bacterium]
MSESRALNIDDAGAPTGPAAPHAAPDQAWLDAIGCLVAVLDRDGRVVAVNRACQAAIGYTRGEILGQAFWTLLLAPLEAEAMQAACGAAETERRGPPQTVLCRARDGAERLIEWSRTWTADPADPAALVILSGNDITEAKAVESALRESERRLAKAQQVAKIGYWRWSLGARGMIYVSRQYTEILGLPPESAPKRQADFNRFLHPEDRGRIAALFEEVSAQPRDYEVEYRVVRPDGEIRHVVEIGELTYDAEGRANGHTGVLQDITGLKRAEALSARLGRIVEDSRNEIYVFDSRSLRFLQVNRGARENLGYSMEELSGLTPLDLKPEFTEARFAALIAPLLDRTLDYLVFQTRHRRKDGSTYDVEVKLQLSRREAPPVFFAIIEDITERKQAEQTLLAAKQDAERASRAKSEFLANMSHELRTPLNVILGFAELIEKEKLGPLGNPAYSGHARQILDAGSHLLALISDVLDMSRLEAGNLTLNEEPLELGELIRASLQLAGDRLPAQEISVGLNVPDDLPWLRGDERRLKQVMINLLSNAFKFTSEGGKVTVTATADPVQGFVIRVADDGIGMAAADIPRALARFGQIDGSLARDFNGTGLGLPLSKALVEMHGGSLEIESAPSAGTVVTLRLPAARLTARPGAKPAPP